MPSKYWIKLYHEILDDPKMGRMSEVLFARCIKFFLLAGDLDKKGTLPAVSDMSWRLRIPEEELESDLIELQKLSITANKEGVWRITKWKDRQRARTSAERTHMWREQKRRAEYVREGPADVTLGDDISDGSSHRVDTDKEADVEIDRDADVEATAAKREFLKTFGVGNPALDDFSNNPELKLSDLQAHFEHGDKRGDSPGLVIHRIRSGDAVPKRVEEIADFWDR